MDYLYLVSYLMYLILLMVLLDTLRSYDGFLSKEEALVVIGQTYAVLAMWLLARFLS